MLSPQLSALKRDKLRRKGRPETNIPQDVRRQIYHRTSGDDDEQDHCKAKQRRERQPQAKKKEKGKSPQLRALRKFKQKAPVKREGENRKTKTRHLQS